MVTPESLVGREAKQFGWFDSNFLVCSFMSSCIECSSPSITKSLQTLEALVDCEFDELAPIIFCHLSQPDGVCSTLVEVLVTAVRGLSV